MAVATGQPAVRRALAGLGAFRGGTRPGFDIAVQQLASAAGDGVERALKWGNEPEFWYFCTSDWYESSIDTAGILV